MRREARVHVVLGLLLLVASPQAAAETVAVTHGGDAGPGSLRQALARASRSPEVDRVAFAPGVEVVLRTGPVVYAGGQALHLDGAGGSVRGGDFDLVVARGGGDLTLEALTLRDGGARGLWVDVPPDASGTVQVTLRRVRVRGLRRFGVHVDDGDGAPAGVRVEVVDATFEEVGVRAPQGSALDDQDGLRVDETGPGDLRAEIRGSRFVGQVYDGVELDERGPGDVGVRVRASRFDRNGRGPTGAPEPDVEDGLDVDEAGPGSVLVDVAGGGASGNLDAGFDLDEAGAGGMEVRLRECEARDNGDRGLVVDEGGPGDLVARVARVALAGNADDGLRLDEGGRGHLRATLRSVRAAANGADGIQLAESEPGDLEARVAGSAAVGNGGAGLQVSQGAPGTGRLVLATTELAGNGRDAPDADGVSIARPGVPGPWPDAPRGEDP